MPKICNFYHLGADPGAGPGAGANDVNMRHCRFVLLANVSAVVVVPVMASALTSRDDAPPAGILFRILSASLFICGRHCCQFAIIGGWWGGGDSLRFFEIL